MTGHRPDGSITPTHEPFRTTDIAWHCIRPDGSECGGPMAEDNHNPDQTKAVWKAARAHVDANPNGHRVVVSRRQQVVLASGEAQSIEADGEDP